MIHLPLVLIALRVPPLIHILWIHPPWVWPINSLLLIGLQLMATGAGFGWFKQRVALRRWQQLEGLHLIGWIVIKSLSPHAALPAGGIIHTLLMLIAACLIPSTQGKRHP